MQKGRGAFGKRGCLTRSTADHRATKADPSPMCSQNQGLVSQEPRLGLLKTKACFGPDQGLVFTCNGAAKRILSPTTAAKDTLCSPRCTSIPRPGGVIVCFLAIGFEVLQYPVNKRAVTISKKEAFTIRPLLIVAPILVINEKL